MKTMRITLLLTALAFLAQVSFSQVIISDKGTASANPKAVLELDTDTKAFQLPRVDFLETGPGGNLEGPIANGHGLMFIQSKPPAFSDFDKIWYYHENDDGTGGWFQVLTNKYANLGYLLDVSRSGVVEGTILTSYYIGNGAGASHGDDDESNTVVGARAGYNMNSSNANTLVGYEAGYNMTTSGEPNNAGDNTAVGAFSGDSVTTGVANTFLGFGSNAATGQGAIDKSTAIGYQAKTTGDESTALGYQAKTNGIHSTAVGADAETNGDNQLVLGTTAESVYIPGLTGTGTEFVKVEADGKLVRSATAPNGPSSNTEIELLKEENKMLRERLEKLEAIVEELVGQGN